MRPLQRSGDRPGNGNSEPNHHGNSALRRSRKVVHNGKKTRAEKTTRMRSFPRPRASTPSMSGREIDNITTCYDGVLWRHALLVWAVGVVRGCSATAWSAELWGSDRTPGFCAPPFGPFTARRKCGSLWVHCFTAANFSLGLRSRDRVPLLSSFFFLGRRHQRECFEVDRKFCNFSPRTGGLSYFAFKVIAGVFELNTTVSLLVYPTSTPAQCKRSAAETWLHTASRVAMSRAQTDGGPPSTWNKD